ncbi:MAG: hypothetical protein JOZ55_02330, partial [Alphaproteobacteria bacterium]|nr:hypothetical protein [Alphaproteobacteria bacterium]
MALINLRGRHPTYGWWRKEEAMCAAHGIARFDTMLDSRRLPTRAMLEELLAAFDAAPKPFLVKCSGGQDRASLAGALYLLHSRGWGALDRAERQLGRFPHLHLPKREQRWMAAFPRYASREAKGAPLARWVSESYAPEAFAAFLEAAGMGDSFAGVFTLPWTPHRRRRRRGRENKAAP